MDCLLAQQTVSANADQEPVDAELLAAARAHCETCADCSRFVRAQIAAVKADLPQPPADLVARVMVAVRDEAASQAAVEVQTMVPASAAAGPGQADVAREPEERAASGFATRRERTVPTTAIITAFAAVVFAGAVGVAIVGSRYISSTSSSGTRELTVGQTGAPSESGAVSQASPPTTDNSAATPQASAVASATVPDFITVAGSVYRSEGAATVDFGTLHDVGIVVSSLSTSGTASQHPARAGADPDLVYIADQSGGILAFRRVKREFGGRTYYLTSADLPAFATWPTLLTKIAPPTTADGYPTFVSAGSDSSGVNIYRLASSPGSGGIGVAPGSPASDPAAGNPNWTYWETSP